MSYYKYYSVTLLIISSVLIVSSSAETVRKAMEKHEVVPDVVDVAPEKCLQVRYPSGVEAELGKELTPTQVKDIPTVSWSAEPDQYYTLCLTDPDAPSRAEPKVREFKHWLVGNIRGQDVDSGDVLAAYVGSGPPKGTGLHRYVFLVYKQPGKLTFDEKPVSNRSRDDRPNFSIRKFAAKYNLGEPVAGNFYQAQYDDYVPTVHKQLGL